MLQDRYGFAPKLRAAAWLRKAVADPPLREDVAGILGVVAQFLPQPCCCFPQCPQYLLFVFRFGLLAAREVMRAAGRATVGREAISAT